MHNGLLFFFGQAPFFFVRRVAMDNAPPPPPPAAEVPLAARKLLARQKMRDLLMAAAASRDKKDFEEETAFLRSLLALSEAGQGEEVTKRLGAKLAEMDKERQDDADRAAAKAKKPSGETMEDAPSAGGSGGSGGSSSGLSLDDETRLQGCLRALAKGEAINVEASAAALWMGLLDAGTGTALSVGAGAESRMVSLGAGAGSGSAGGGDEDDDDEDARNAAVLRHLDGLLSRDGFFVIPRFRWTLGDVGPGVEGLAAAMDSLKCAGWPPVFVYMYDQAWQLISQLWSVMEGFLGADCVLEPSFFAWSVGPLKPESGNVGSNFGLPHRDYPASEALYAAGEGPEGVVGGTQQPKLLSVWVPLNDATLDNGCMYAVPREFDANFDKSDDQAHMRSAGEVRPGVYKIRFPLHGARPLPAPAGSVLCWNGNTIHWGASCSRHTSAAPRKSMAMTFRRAEVAQLEGGGSPISRESAAPSAMAPEMRLALISRALLLYSQWYTLKDTAVPPLLYKTS
jgi:hypothetical protein